MNIEIEILLNKFGQGIEKKDKIVEIFEVLSLENKRLILLDIENLINQSKITNYDINKAIIKSGLKSTYTPCVMIRNGFNYGNVKKIINLPETEIKKVFLLFINLFSIGYYNRYIKEKGNPLKWWYWDLSINENITKIMNNNF